MSWLSRTFIRHSSDTRSPNSQDHCTSQEEGNYLASRELGSLTPTELYGYTGKAMTTWGSVDDFKHFFPRICEISAKPHEHPRLDVEIVLGKLGYGQFATWAKAEQAAVRRFLHGFWAELLQTYPYFEDADSLLCGIGNAERDVGQYLETWAMNDSRTSTLHLAEFAQWNCSFTNKHPSGEHLFNAFWGDRPPAESQVFRWLMEPARRSRLEEGFFAATDAEIQQMISDAAYLLGVRQLAYAEHMQNCKKI